MDLIREELLRQEKALELLLLCFALSVLVQVYLQGSTWNFALIGTGTALVVLSLDWLFFYYMPGYSWALSSPLCCPRQ